MALPLEKTILGVIPNINAVLSDFEYLPQTKGRRVEGKYFIGSKFAPIKSFSPKYRDALHATVEPVTLEKIKAQCCEGKLGGFQLIPWQSEGVALLLAIDALCIARVWVGFIPLGSLPSLECEK